MAAGPPSSRRRESLFLSGLTSRRGSQEGLASAPRRLPPGLRASAWPDLSCLPLQPPGPPRARRCVGDSAKRLQDEAGYISPRIIIITHPHRAEAARQTKGGSKKGRGRGRSYTGGEFRDTAELPGGEKRQLCMCVQTSANKQGAAAGRPPRGEVPGRSGRRPGLCRRVGPSPAPAPGTVAACGGLEWLRKM